MLAANILRRLMFPLMGLTRPAADPHLPSKDISAGLLANLTLFSEYAAASTCAANFNSHTLSKVVCDPGVCPTLEQTDTNVMVGFMGHHPGNVTGFVAIDNTNQLIVLSFRGSRTLGNYITDSKYQQVPAICPGCQVHKGYYWAWGNFSAFIMQPINQLAAIYPSYQIVFTGHSFGGALATLGAALEGGNPSRPIDLYTFGCPQLGNHDFAEFVTAVTAGSGYRVTHSDDPVPRVFSTQPWINKTWQYSTTSPEFWITTGNGVPVTASDIQVIEGIDNKSGNLGTTGSDTSAHIWYIGNMSGCSTN